MSYLGDEHAGAHDADRACVFCAIAARNTDDEDYVLHRGATCFVVMNLYPYNNGHVMVIPYAHVPSLLDLDDATAHEMMDLARRSQTVLDGALAPHGVNLGMNQGTAAGAGIAQHLHLHVVPRWAADTNFITTVGQIRVMPQALRDTYDLLRPGFDT